MPQVIVSDSAREDLQRLQNVLITKSPLAAKKAAGMLIRGIRQLESVPQAG